MDSNVEFFLKAILDVCKFTMLKLFIKVINVVCLLIQLKKVSLSHAHCLHAKYYSINTSSHLSHWNCLSNRHCMWPEQMVMGIEIFDSCNTFR